MRASRRILFVALGAAITVAVIVALVAILTPRLNHVEVAAQGAPGITMTFADDTQSYTEEWPSTEPWWKRYTTTTSTAYVTVTAPADALSDTVTCRILWNERVVVEQSSDSGEVTCRYQAGPFGF